MNTTFHTNTGPVDQLERIRQAAKDSHAEIREGPLQKGANVVYVYIADDRDALTFKLAVPQEFAQILTAAFIGAGEDDAAD